LFLFYYPQFSALSNKMPKKLLEIELLTFFSILYNKRKTKEMSEKLLGNRARQL
jgi:hypothetical protein